MTYPQQPQYAPQPTGYAPPTATQPTYMQPTAGQPQYAQPPMQAPVATYAPPQFSDPTGGTGGAPLKIRELEHRACGIRPVKHIPATPGAMFMGAPQSDSIVIDVLVLDGPTPLQYGESRANDGTAGPACYAVDTLPVEIKGVIVNNTEVVKACREILDAAPGNVIPCRVVRGTQGNRPYLLAALGSALDPQAASADQVRGMLGAAYVAIGTGRWPDGTPYTAPVPREINGGPRQKPQQNTPQAAPAQYPPAPAGQVVYPPPVAQATAPAFIAAGTMPPQAQYAPGSREAFLSGQDVPPGWQEPTWRGMTNEQRAQFL